VRQQISPRGRPAIISDDELLDVARAVFLEHGLDATTADVAERARVSTSLIFYRYKTKEALFTAVFKRETRVPAFFEKLARHAGTGRIADTLFDAGMSIVEAMQTALPLSMMAWSSTKLSAAIHEHLKRNPERDRTIKLLVGYFDREIALGRMGGHEPAVIANAFLGGVVDYLMNQYFSHGKTRAPAAAAFLRQLIALLLDGCAPRRPVRPRSSRR
jgi:AcrR family transcriptional regulator